MLKYSLTFLIFCSLGAFASVLPEDRADILYHSFDGGGVTITGPSVLVRKQFLNTVSVWGNYYVDHVTSASIDVLSSGASEYTEERTQQTAGVDYLVDRATLSGFYSTSVENDYDAETFGLSVSQDFFGDLTTVSMSYVQGDDIVRNNTDPDFRESTQRKRYGVGFSQIMTRNWILSLNAESVTDQGFLRNPYRSVRFLRAGVAAFQEESYPTTRNSDALAIRSMLYLPWNASLRLEYRRFEDSWGIDSDNAEIRYLHPLGEDLIVESKLRYYEQTQADFYSDLFPFRDAQNFLARDKELSTFSDVGIGLGLSYKLHSEFLSALDEVTLNLFFDYMQFDFKNFRDTRPEVRAEFDAGNEPLYQFNSNIIRFFVSITY